jgi:hypothetical protein
MKRTLALVAATTIVGAAVVVGTDEGAHGCTSVPLAVIVDLRDDHEQVVAHAQDAVRAGHPRVLHLARAGAQMRRKLSLRGIPTRRGLDRDEYPPAVSREGGAHADVRYIESSENRSAGSLMGRQLRSFCEGQAFVVEP